VRICPGCRSTYPDHLCACTKDELPLIERSAVVRAGEASESGVGLPSGSLVGDYRIEGVLARGSLGRVYAGIHPLIRKPVAIKVLRKRLLPDASVVVNFVRDVYGVNELGHPSIVDVLSIGELDEGRYYLVMELLDGLNLRDLLRLETRLEPGLVLPILEQLCHALDAAHLRGFVHRELEPRHIVVLRAPPRPLIRILGFGAAWLRSGSVVGVQEPTLAGAPGYVAPEQRRGEAVDARTDVYAAGALLHELVTGHPPRSGEVPAQEASRPSDLAPVDEALERVILRSTAIRPEDRFVTAESLIAALREAIGAPRPWTLDLDRPPPAPEVEPTTGPTAHAPPAAVTPAPQEGSVPGPEVIGGDVPQDEIETPHAEVKVRRWEGEEPGERRGRPTQERIAGPPRSGADVLAPSSLLGELDSAELDELNDTESEGPVHVMLGPGKARARQSPPKAVSGVIDVDEEAPTGVVEVDDRVPPGVLVVDDEAPVIEVGEEPPTATQMTRPGVPPPEIQRLAERTEPGPAYQEDETRPYGRPERAQAEPEEPPAEHVVVLPAQGTGDDARAWHEELDRTRPEGPGGRAEHDVPVARLSTILGVGEPEEPGALSITEKVPALDAPGEELAPGRPAPQSLARVKLVKKKASDVHGAITEEAARPKTACAKTSPLPVVETPDAEEDPYESIELVVEPSEDEG
jgi:serine/threonine protein kinase